MPDRTTVVVLLYASIVLLFYFIDRIGPTKPNALGPFRETQAPRTGRSRHPVPPLRRAFPYRAIWVVAVAAVVLFGYSAQYGVTSAWGRSGRYVAAVIIATAVICTLYLLTNGGDSSRDT